MIEIILLLIITLAFIIFYVIGKVHGKEEIQKEIVRRKLGQFVADENGDVVFKYKEGSQ